METELRTSFGPIFKHHEEAEFYSNLAQRLLLEQKIHFEVRMYVLCMKIAEILTSELKYTQGSWALECFGSKKFFPKIFGDEIHAWSSKKCWSLELKWAPICVLSELSCTRSKFCKAQKLETDIFYFKNNQLPMLAGKEGSAAIFTEINYLIITKIRKKPG